MPGPISGASLLALAALALAWWFGGGPERGAAGVLIALLAAEFGLSRLASTNHGAITAVAPWLHVAAHGLAFAGLLLVAIAANRFYPIVMAAGQLIVLVAQALAVAHPLGASIGYSLLIGTARHVALVVLCIGLFAHARRTARIGRYPDWRADHREPG